MGKKLVFLLMVACLLASTAAYPQSKLLARAGFVDLDRIVHEYAVEYLDSEIAMREKSLRTLRESFQSMKDGDLNEEGESIEKKIGEHREALSSLRRELNYLGRTGELRSDRLAEIVDNNVLNEVRKTAEIEGFSIVLDMGDDFVYGSREVDLTDKVLRRLRRGLSGLADEE